MNYWKLTKEQLIRRLKEAEKVLKDFGIYC